MKRILIIGHKGQLGQTIMAMPSHYEHLGIDLPEHDITDPADAIPTLLDLHPDAVINPAAFTNVDAAEANPDLAYGVNAHGAGNIARACHQLGVPLIHISTNEVFDGTAAQPYDEWDQPHALSIYARSKLAGEQAVRFYHDDVRIVRIAWLFAAGGNNFPGKIVAAAQKYGALRVVDDEFGNPTYAPDLASALLRLLDVEVPPGIYHITNAGVCSRHEWAAEVLQQMGMGHMPL
ncbi:MAG: dTDP-4-dehydrorhamnose reductase, partial [Chloroflexi bacterium]|nr:dTDP-4-dehydrorhamnose reductase [Chloroflexota bacterium]